MFGYSKVVVARHERGLLFRNRSLEAILEPGVYRRLDPLRRVEVELYDLNRPQLERAGAELLVRTAPAECRDRLQLVEIGEQEVGLVHYDGRLQGVIPPASSRVYWNGPIEVRVERLAIGDQLRVPQRITDLLARSRGGSAARELAGWVQLVELQAQQGGLLFVDGRLTERLGPGLHAFWTFHRSVRVETFDERLQSLEVAGQEILTRDKVSLRLNLAAGYRLTDPVKARSGLEDWKGFLYRELQLALRQAVGNRTLEQLLEAKDSLERGLHERVAARVAPHGLELLEIGIKDVILPGEMRAILNQLVEAEKAAQANVIKRREETAATRSLLNTAKLMEDNPLLLRLKELEVLERVTERIDRFTVFGGLESVLGDLVKIGRIQGQ